MSDLNMLLSCFREKMSDLNQARESAAAKEAEARKSAEGLEARLAERQAQGCNSIGNIFALVLA